MQVALNIPLSYQAKLLPRLLTVITPWQTVHTHNIRTFAQLLTHAMLTTFPPDHPVWGHKGEADVAYWRQMQLFYDTNQVSWPSSHLVPARSFQAQQVDVAARLKHGVLQAWMLLSFSWRNCFPCVCARVEPKRHDEFLQITGSHLWSYLTWLLLLYRTL
jgi:hypothetical protein